jgi:TRAP-type mannitol/chloroaromatic compound transport system permease small subunit
MSFAIQVYNRLDVFVSRIGYLFGWLMYPLIAITIFDVVTRRFFVLGSTYLQESEWHLHTMVFATAIAYAYLRNRQVRIDIFRAHWAPRRQAWVELFGCLIFLIPYGIMLVIYGYYFSEISWAQNEISSSAMGLSNRWAIKAFIPLVGVLLLLAGGAVIIRTALFLFGPQELREQFNAVAMYGETKEGAGEIPEY